MKHHSRKGFTLIEFLTILMVIGILAGMVFSIGTMAGRRMSSQRARAEIAALDAALEAYKQDNGFYPVGNGSSGSSIILYQALINGSRHYMSGDRIRKSGSMLLDPFGDEYLYKSPGIYNAVTFDLWSLGPDQASNTADDIANYKAN